MNYYITHFNNLIPKNQVINLFLNKSKGKFISEEENDPTTEKISFYTENEIKIIGKNQTKKLFEYSLEEKEDSILNFHLQIIQNTKVLLVLVTSNSKKILFFEFDLLKETEIKEAEFIYIHMKRITNSITHYDSESSKTHLIFADKFGEIFLIDISEMKNYFLTEKITPEEYLKAFKFKYDQATQIEKTKKIKEKKMKEYEMKQKGIEIAPEVEEEKNELRIEKIDPPIYFLYGHSESISFLIKNESNIISSDCLGRIKFVSFLIYLKLELFSFIKTSIIWASSIKINIY